MRSILIQILAIGLLVCFAQPLALAKKKEKFNVKARLRSIEAVYVEGYNRSADYVRQNLSEQTCLTYTPSRGEADAVLEVRENLQPCEQSLGRRCQSVSGKLYDRESMKLLWFREDESLLVSVPLGGMNTRAEWILRDLDHACCEGRPLPPRPNPYGGMERFDRGGSHPVANLVLRLLIRVARTCLWAC
jgi:hypothetical protein